MKKKSIVATIAIVLLVLVIVGILLLTKVFNKPNKENELIKLTNEFYGYYYTEIAKNNDAEKFLKGYKDSGLKISLGDIEIYLNGKSENELDFSIFDKCDVDKTYSTIFPKSPYGKKDLEVKVNLSCQK